MRSVEMVTGISGLARNVEKVELLSSKLPVRNVHDAWHQSDTKQSANLSGHTYMLVNHRYSVPRSGNILRMLALQIENVSRDVDTKEGKARLQDLE